MTPQDALPKRSSTSSPTPLRVGVVGTAHWAQEVHAAGVVAAPSTELVAVWGRTPGTTSRFAERYDVDAATSLAELVDSVDMVTFAVPPRAQPDLAAVAARAGKHLLLEKPVATSPAAAEALRTAVRQGGGQAAVFFTRRFVPELEQQLRWATGQVWSGARVTWHADFAADGSPYRDSVWRAEPLAALWDLTPHVLSQLIPVLGDVMAVDAEVAGQAAGDGVRVRTRHASGASADISVSLRAPLYVEELLLVRPDGTEVPLATPSFDAVDAFAAACDRLAARATDPTLDEPASLDLGVEVTRVLAQAERCLEPSRS